MEVEVVVVEWGGCWLSVVETVVVLLASHEPVTTGHDRFLIGPLISTIAKDRGPDRGLSLLRSWELRS